MNHEEDFRFVQQSFATFYGWIVFIIGENKSQFMFNCILRFVYWKYTEFMLEFNVWILRKKQNFASCLPKAVCCIDLTTVWLGQTNANFRSDSTFFFFSFSATCQFQSGVSRYQVSLSKYFDSSHRYSQAADSYRFECCALWMGVAIVNDSCWLFFLL